MAQCWMHCGSKIACEAPDRADDVYARTASEQVLGAIVRAFS
jgi:hypothetical protein